MSKRLGHLVTTLAFLVRHRQLGSILRRIRHKFYSDTPSFGLRRDLTIPFTPPDANLPLTIRPLAERDIPVLLGTDAPSGTEEGAKDRTDRRLLVQEQVPTCYVAVTPDDQPCYMQWLIGSGENERIRTFFAGGFPQLAPDEALLEYAFTLEAYRGQRIMPCAMAQIAQKAADFGARWVITFVIHNNIPSLKGCKRAGFMPYLLRHDRWRLFRRRLTFTRLPDGTPYPFDREPQSHDSAAHPSPAQAGEGTRRAEYASVHA